MAQKELLPYEGQAIESDILLYGSICGSIIYSSIVTRPDIAFTAGKIAQFLTNPGPDHIAAGKRSMFSTTSGHR
jgi:hypothetical protein